MTSPWSSVFTSSPGMTIRSRVLACSAASSAPPKTLWSVTAIAAEADRLGVVEQILGRDRAVVRPVGVHVEVDRDPVSIGHGVDVPFADAAPLPREASSRRRRARPRRAEALRSACRERGCRASRSGRLGSCDESLGVLVALDDRERRPRPPRGRVAVRLLAQGRRSPRGRERLRAAGKCAPPSRERGRGADRGIAGRTPSGFVWRSVASHSGRPLRMRSRARVVGRPATSSSAAMRSRFVPGAKGSRSIPRGTTRYSPSKRSLAASAVSGEVASSASTRVRRRSRRELLAGG